jgi:fucose permease
MTPDSRARAPSVVLLLLAFIGFVSLGLPDGLLGVGWPSIRAFFSLPLDALGALFITSTSGYVVASFASGWLLSRMRLGTLLSASCLTTAASLICFAVAPSWGWMVAAGLLAGFGAGAIDAGINTFAASYYSARTVNLLHAFFGIGAAAGPMIMTAVLAAGHVWQRGYVIVGVTQLALAVCFALTRRRWPQVQPITVHDATSELTRPMTIGDTLRLRSTQFSIAVFILYTGLEATAGVWIYSLLVNGRQVAATEAALAVSAFWAGLTGARILFGILTIGGQYDRFLGMCTTGMVIGALALLVDLSDATNFFAVALLGFAAGPVFPMLIATTPQRLGTVHTANAVGIQIASAALGLSAIPSLVGVLADQYGFESIPAALLVLTLLLTGTHRLLAIGSRERFS